MSIPLPSQRDELIVHLTREIGRNLATKTVLFHSALAARLGLSATDLKCLDLLRNADQPLTASQLADLTGLSAGAITGVIDRLESSGLVERIRDPTDRRRWELYPVPGTRQEVLDLFAPLRADIAQLCADYSDRDLRLVARFLEGLGSALDTGAARLRNRPTTTET